VVEWRREGHWNSENMAATAAAIGSTGDVLFLGSILLLIRCVCADLVLFEVAEKSGMDPDGAGDGAHDVLGERSGVSSADDGGVCHRLTRTENTNKEVFLTGHSFRGKSKHRSYRKQEALQKSDNDQCYRDDEIILSKELLVASVTLEWSFHCAI